MQPCRRIRMRIIRTSCCRVLIRHCELRGASDKLANPNPAGVTYAQFYPDPNVPGATGTANNWAASIPNKLNWSEWNVRADYDFNKANRATFRWTQDSWTNPAPNPGTFWGDSIFPTVAANWSQPSKSVMGKLTSTISNTMVNDVEFGYGHNAIITSLGGSNPGSGSANCGGDSAVVAFFH